MDKKKLVEVQAARGAKSNSFDTNTKTLETVLTECRKKIEEMSDTYRDLDVLEKKEALRSIIIDFVMTTSPLVVGYISEDNRPDTTKLVDKLIEEITDYGILTAAMLDEKVFEIRCNGKEIKVEIQGHVTDLLDKDGNIVSFESPEQQEVILRKFLGDVRLTPKDAIVNGRTIEGYRIAAVHNSAMSPDPNDPTAEKYHAFVLRKFNKVKMTLSDTVKKGSLSDNMARLLTLLPAGGLTFFTVGATGSGKTTLNNSILQAVPAGTRTVLLQNPSEIDLRFKDATGRMYNDALHLEAKDIDNPSPNDPTMSNLMDHTLRLTPSFVCLGEIRSNLEFAQAVKILNAGHPLNSTYHADSSEGAISRFMTAYLAEAGNIPSHLALSMLTSLLDIIIVQKKMRDGTRKIIQISEVLGVDPEDNNKPLINDLYIYDIDEDPEYDEAGNIVKIRGHHKRVGKMSDRLLRKLQLEGVAKSRYAFLLEEISKSEVETYTGLNI